MLREVRYAVRQLARHPVTTVMAAVTLALSLGGFAAVFSVVDLSVLRPPPYPDLDRLVTLTHTGVGPATSAVVSAPNFRDWESQAQSFEALSAMHTGDLRPFVGGTPVSERVEVARASPGYFCRLRHRGSSRTGFPHDGRPH